MEFPRSESFEPTKFDLKKLDNHTRLKIAKYEPKAIQYILKNDDLDGKLVWRAVTYEGLSQIYPYLMDGQIIDALMYCLWEKCEDDSPKAQERFKKLFEIENFRFFAVQQEGELFDIFPSEYQTSELFFEALKQTLSIYYASEPEHISSDCIF